MTYLSTFDRIHNIEEPKEYPVKKGMNGKDVKLIQEWLNLRGFGTGIDADYGPATAGAVTQFQKANILNQTGEVDETTFIKLSEPMSQSLEKFADLQTLPLNMIYLANKIYGNGCKEIPQNRGPWIRLFCQGNEGPSFPWCAGFVSFIIKMSYRIMDKKYPFEYTLSCDNLAYQAKKLNIFQTGKEYVPQPGDIFLNIKSPGDWYHTGIVLESFSDYFTTLEGNSNSAGSSEGIEVCSLHRSYKNRDFINMQKI